MIEAYTSLQRVTAALEHREADRVPFDLGGTAVTSINMNALRKLRAYLRLPENRSFAILSRKSAGSTMSWSKGSALT
jgi:hypothetical protein